MLFFSYEIGSSPEKDMFVNGERKKERRSGKMLRDLSLESFLSPR